MRIKKIESQHRRDFFAIYECEHCGVTKPMPGYDDTNYHNNVIPNMVCDYCGKKATSDYRPRATVHPEGVVL